MARSNRYKLRRAANAIGRRAFEANGPVDVRLPDFVCIGAQKAGTSWLDQMLAQHPDTWNPGIKEIHYFDRARRNGRVPSSQAGNLFRQVRKAELAGRLVRRTGLAGLAERRFARGPQPPLADPLLRQIRKAGSKRELDLPAGLLARIISDGLGLDEYAALFAQAPDDKLVWEISPSYSAMEDWRINTMLRVLSKAKFLYLIREPAARAESSLRMALERSDSIFGRTPPREDVAREWLETRKGISRSDYADTIPRWDARLAGTGRLLYLPFGMIKTDPSATIRRVEDFLGLEPFDGYDGLSEPYNPTRKIALPDFAAEEIRRRMEPHRAYLRERFGEDFAALT